MNLQQANSLRPAALFVLFLPCMLSLPDAVGRAQVRTWQNAGGGNWADDPNWSDSDRPDTAAETAMLGLGSAYTVLYNLPGVTVGDLQWDNANATLTFSPTISNSVLNVNSDFTVNGTLNLNSDNVLDVTLNSTGTITNSATGMIAFGGTSTSAGTQRSISADIVNNGSILVNRNGRVTKAGASITNNNQFTTAVGAAFTNTNVITFNQDAGTLTNNGSLQMSGDTFNFNGGNLAGNNIQLSSSALNIGVGSVGAGVFDVSGTSTFSGDVAAAQTVNLIPTGSNAVLTSSTGFTNHGNINLNSDSTLDVTLNVGGTLTNEGTLRFGGTSTSAGTLRSFQGDLINNGTVLVDQSARSIQANAVLTNNGDFTIAAGKEFRNTTVTTFNQDAGTLTIDGQFVMSGDTFNFNGGAIVGNNIQLASSALAIGAGNTSAATFDIIGNSTIAGDIAAAQTLNLLAQSGNSVVTAGADFTNHGTINLNSDSTLDVSLTRVGSITNEGTIHFGGTSISAGTLRSLDTDLVNNGSVNVARNARSIRANGVLTNNNDFTVQDGATFSNTSTTTFNQDAGTLANNGSFVMSGDTFNFNGGELTGNNISLTSSTLSIGAGSVGAGSFDMFGAGAINGQLAAAQTVNVLAAGGNVVVTAGADFNNGGTVNINSDSTLDATLQKVGTITNTGTILFGGTSTSAGTIRTLDTAIDNQGLVDILATGTSTRIGQVGAEHVNSGTITSHAAGNVVTFSGNSFTNQGGRIEGIGELDFTATGLINNGVLAPGLSPGILTLDGDVLLGAASTLEFELGGLVAGTEFDVLNVLDSLSLNGGLDVRFANGFQGLIQSTDSFTIINANSLSGNFTGLANGATFITSDGFGQFTVNYSGTDVTLSNFQLTAVPEPGAVGLLSLLAFGLLWHRKRQAG